MPHISVDHEIEQPDRILTEKELRTLIPFSQMHIWRMERANRFPRRIKLGAHRVGWSLREITAWLEQRKSERQQAPA